MQNLIGVSSNPLHFPSPHQHPITVLLIDDQVIIAEAIRRMLIDEKDIVLSYCQDPSKAIQMAAEISPTVILQDLVMPGIDGLMLLRFFRANSSTKDVPMIVLSSKEEPKTKAEAFALGANDYLVKLPDKVELIARIRHHSKGYISLLERNEAYLKLEASQKVLRSELAEAADYVKSLLPLPLKNGIQAYWKFIPSTQLGGDAFGYHWLNSDNFAIYLLDVCGHGIGAALLSISVMNVIRSQTLSYANFFNPDQVLMALNEAFPMEKHNNMFFTIWYGIYNKPKRNIVYASGGHPPALLVRGASESKKIIELKTPGLVIGGMSGAVFQSMSTQIEPGDKLFLFSDGVYELNKPNGKMLQLSEFEEFLIKSSEKNEHNAEDGMESIVQFAQSFNGPGPFPDDFSIIQLIFE